MTAHVDSRHRIHLPVAADTALPFFTPVGEEYWVAEWQPSYLWPHERSNRPGTVFTTGHGPEATIWTVVDYDKRARRARYVRTTPGVRTGIVDVSAVPLGLDSCEVQIGYSMTALGAREAAAQALAPYAGEAFVRMIEAWRGLILDALPTLLSKDLP